MENLYAFEHLHRMKELNKLRFPMAENGAVDKTKDISSLSKKYFSD